MLNLAALPVAYAESFGQYTYCPEMYYATGSRYDYDAGYTRYMACDDDYNCNYQYCRDRGTHNSYSYGDCYYDGYSCYPQVYPEDRFIDNMIPSLGVSAYALAFADFPSFLEVRSSARLTQCQHGILLLLFWWTERQSSAPCT